MLKNWIFGRGCTKICRKQTSGERGISDAVEKRSEMEAMVKKNGKIEVAGRFKGILKTCGDLQRI